jgi:phenylacetate-CoA ligase
MMLAPEVETRPWAQQLAVDDATYRAQLAYLFERSDFYRRKLPAAGVTSDRAAGGLVDIAQLPLTEKHEIKATSIPDNPIGAHLCAAPADIVRIYSTSGTTGTPSYIPLTAGDLESWVTGSARSYAASGVTAGQRIVSSYNAGPFVAGAALAAFERIGLCHIPVGTGNTERLMKAIELLAPEVAVATPSYAAYVVEWAAERDLDLRGCSVERVLVAGEPGGGEPAFRAKLEQGWGATVTEAMGALQDRGAVVYEMGRVRVHDRAALERAACECYAIIQREFDRLLRVPGARRRELPDPFAGVRSSDNGRSAVRDGTPRGAGADAVREDT